MNSEGQKRNLGRGLSALLGGQGGGEPVAPLRAQRSLPVEQIHPGAFQPRQRFDQEELEALAESVRQNGILQPILVRPRPNHPGSFEIVAGERRWRAAQHAQHHEEPIIIKDLGDREALELAIVENVQRENLSPLEEARGYRRLIDEFGNTQEDLSQHVGKSRSHIANTLRLLDLPDAVQALLDDGKLTAGHARALIGTPDPAALAALVVGRGLNVRQAERLAKFGRSAPKPRVRTEKDADTRALERDLTARLGLQVTIAGQGESGHVTVHYKSLEQLDLIIARLRGDPVN
ncbi:MAG TPA: ParB/RepB/Spo0J family partition protein [Dongiaceae bacterium]